MNSKSSSMNTSNNIRGNKNGDKEALQNWVHHKIFKTLTNAKEGRYITFFGAARPGGRA